MEIGAVQTAVNCLLLQARIVYRKSLYSLMLQFPGEQDRGETNT